MESPENNNAVFRPFHKPWKSIKPIPTFPPPRRRSIYERIPKRSRPRCPPQTHPSGSSLDWKRLKPRSAPAATPLTCLAAGRLNRVEGVNAGVEAFDNRTNFNPFAGLGQNA